MKVVLLNEMCWLNIILTDKNYIDRELAKADKKEELEVKRIELELLELVSIDCCRE